MLKFIDQATMYYMVKVAMHPYKVGIPAMLAPFALSGGAFAIAPNNEAMILLIFPIFLNSLLVLMSIIRGFVYRTGGLIQRRPMINHHVHIRVNIVV